MWSDFITKITNWLLGLPVFAKGLLLLIVFVFWLMHMQNKQNSNLSKK